MRFQKLTIKSTLEILLLRDYQVAPMILLFVYLKQVNCAQELGLALTLCMSAGVY